MPSDTPQMDSRSVLFLRGLGSPSSVYSPTKIQGTEGKGRVMFPRTLKIGCLNVHEYSILEGIREVIDRMFVKHKVDVSIE